MTNGSLGNRLRDERIRLTLKQEDLAQVGGVNRNTQGSYERDARSPDAAYLVAVAAIGIDVMYVLTGVRDVSKSGDLTPGESKVLANYRALPEKDQASVRRLTDALAQSLGDTEEDAS
ncbi:transcriptional regulator [Pseudomonas sp. 57B-090624]|uniref:helix-turn-helix domain-containing protein n=1 Tax=Pseudomonas sp. 57B-090624 TaxID=2213080 RepID=UPI000DA8F36E|nr:helix-turn-helix domain-containing protein [Pseudomonas sp. 57B-090624]PZE12268.1 transcriptional regulator [Pseudomonas sp. 57B-090624]